MDRYSTQKVLVEKTKKRIARISRYNIKMDLTGTEGDNMAGVMRFRISSNGSLF